MRRGGVHQHATGWSTPTCDGVEYTYLMSSWPLFLIIQVAPEDRTCDGVEYTYLMSSWPLFLIIQVAPEDRTCDGVEYTNMRRGGVHLLDVKLASLLDHTSGTRR